MTTPDPEAAQPLALVAQIAELLPTLDKRELDQLADGVEALTEAIGLRMDWTSEESATD